MNDTDEWFEVEELSEGTWRVAESTVFGNYLVAGEERALLLDGSIGVGDLRAMVDRLVDVPVTQVLTHSHWDHIGAAPQFDDVRIHEAEIADGGEVRADYVAGEDIFGAEDWLAAQLEAGATFPEGFDPETFEIEPVRGVDPVEPGETIDLGGRELEFIHLPGHSPGQLGALDRDRGVLFGGDVIHVDHSLYVHFGGCDLEAYADTLARLRALREDGVFETLYTAHNPPLSGEDLSMIDEFHDGVASILTDELPYEPHDGAPAGRVYDVGGKDVITKPDVT